MTEKNEKPSIEQQVAEWSATDAALHEAVKATDGLTIAGHVDGPKAGYRAVEAARKALKTHRTGIENRRKELKAPILDLGRKVDEEAKRLTAIVEPRERELDKDSEAYEAEQARIALEAADAKRRMVEERLAIMAKYGIAPNLSLVDSATPEEWSAKVAGWEEEAAEAARKAEEERIERERLEAERKAEADRLEAERAAERAKEKAERERLEKAAQRMRELAAVGSLLTLDECAAMDDATFAAALASATASHAEAQRKADDIRQENARLQREADARAEADRAEAQRKEREAQEEADRVKREAGEAEARRLEEEARPSIDKAHAWLDSILDAIAAVPTVESDTVRRDIARAASVLRETVEGERQAIMPY